MNKVRGVVRGENARTLVVVFDEPVSDQGMRDFHDRVRGPIRDMTAFSEQNLARCEAPTGFNQPIHSWDLSDWFLATMGELGEAANVAKKLNRIRDGIKGNKESLPELEAKLRKELGDTFCYLDLIATSRGFNIFDAAQEVFDAKSQEIGYQPARQQS